MLPASVNMSKKLSLSSFKWTEAEFTLREILERFGHQLPLLISVVQGYSGRDGDQHEVPVDEIAWVYDIARQSRVVLKDDNDRYYSIPTAYEGKFTHLGEDGRVCTTEIVLQDLLRYPDKYKYVRLSGDANRSRVCDGAKEVVMHDLDWLQVVDIYDEKFLVGHNLINGEIEEHFVLTPVYMPITVSLAMASTDGRPQTFFETMLEFKHFTQRCSHDYEKHLEIFRDIMAFDGKPSSGDYDYIATIPLERSKRKSEKVQDPLNPLPLESRSGPIAYGTLPEDRLIQLKHVLYNETIPDEYAGLDLDRPKVSTNKTNPNLSLKGATSKIKNMFGSGQKKTKSKESTKAASIESNSIRYVRNTDAGPASTRKMRVDKRESQIDSGTYQKLQQPLIRPSDLNQSRLKQVHTSDGGNLCQKPQSLQEEHPERPAISTPRRQERSLSITTDKLPSMKREVTPPRPSNHDQFKCLADVPMDLSSLTLDQVGDCLDLLSLSAYKDTFVDNLVDGGLLAAIDESALEGDLGLSHFNAIKVMKFKEGWRPK